MAPDGEARGHKKGMHSWSLGTHMRSRYSSSVSGFSAMALYVADAHGVSYEETHKRRDS